MGWNDRLDNPDAHEEYVEAELDRADRERDREERLADEAGVESSAYAEHLRESREMEAWKERKEQKEDE